MKYRYYLVIIFISLTNVLKSQTVPAGTEIQELVRISQLYENMPYLSFDLRYTYADSLTWTDLVDSSAANCKISYGRSFISNSEMEMLKSSQYFVFVDKEDSTVIAAPLHNYESIFQMPLLDSVFREANVESMSITDWNDSTWKFNVVFKPGSYYSFFEMMYDPATGLIRSVNYHGLNANGEHGLPEDHVLCAYVYMNNYSTAGEDPAVFNENRYFYLLNGTMYLQPAWQQYHLEN